MSGPRSGLKFEGLALPVHAALAFAAGRAYHLSASLAPPSCPLLRTQTMRYLALPLLACLLSGCAVVAVADLAVTSVVTVAKVGVKTVGAAVDAVIPDKKSDAEKSKGR